MRDLIKAALVALVLSVGFAAPLAAGPLEDGVAAYDRGDYATAVRLWRPLADQGYADAQFDLGVMYGNGEGVPQDYVQAHMWSDLAASASTGRRRDEAVELRARIAAKMTPAQIAEAQKLGPRVETQMTSALDRAEEPGEEERRPTYLPAPIGLQP